MARFQRGWLRVDSRKNGPTWGAPLLRKQKDAAIESLPQGAFLAPKLIAQISYTELTKDGKVRHPVYLGLRDDKDATEVLLPQI